MISVIVMIGLATTWLLDAFDLNGFPVRFLAVLAGIIAFAAVALILGRTLRVLRLDMVDKSTSPLQTQFGPVFGDEAVQTGLLFPE
jgi:hypothetical protein